MSDHEAKIIKVKHKGGHMWAYVDDDDYQRIAKYSWWSRGQGQSSFYAFRITKFKKEPRVYSMHREILGIHETHYRSKDIIVDHINRNGLDNRKSNLRLCTRSENLANSKKHKHGVTSKYRGVSWNKKCGRWRAHVRVNNKLISLGSFKDEIDAAKAYNKGAFKYFGQFSNQNKIEET